MVESAFRSRFISGLLIGVDLALHVATAPDETTTARGFGWETATEVAFGTPANGAETFALGTGGGGGPRAGVATGLPAEHLYACLWCVCVC